MRDAASLALRELSGAERWVPLVSAALARSSASRTATASSAVAAPRTTCTVAPSVSPVPVTPEDSRVPAMPPPAAVIHQLVQGPSLIAGVQWHEEVASTNALAARAAEQGLAEIHVVLADLQTEGRGRNGRTWSAPPGTSLLHSYLLRPRVSAAAYPLVSLLAALALAESVEGLLPPGLAALKWPNDLLLGPERRKAAGVLVEGVGGGAVVVGIGVNVDWRGVERPPELAAATSLAEVAAAAGVGPPDRWTLFAALAERLSARYQAWQDDPGAFLDDYRARCVTLGTEVRVDTATDTLTGRATALASDGALLVTTPDGTTTRLVAGDVHHVRPAGS
jgi:BirA family biotin operon repressor/biotin-[acetyl-CoA-carboxylase] ligase